MGALFHLLYTQECSSTIFALLFLQPFFFLQSFNISFSESLLYYLHMSFYLYHKVS